jgi:DNA-binding MarR family transcriptional regulator
VTEAGDQHGALARALWQAQHVVEQVFDAALEPLRLSTSLVGTMAFVAAEPGLSAADLARQARVKPQSAAHLITRLEAMGLLTRTPHPVHGRVLRLYLTDEGRDLLDRASTVNRRTGERVFGDLAEQERTALLDQLTAVHSRAAALANDF